MNKIPLIAAAAVLGIGGGWLFHHYRQAHLEQKKVAEARGKVADLIKDVPEIVKPSR